jgi:TPR repeat protein
MSGSMKKMVALAESGGAESQFNLGVVYSNPLDANGHHTSGNRGEAIRWLLAAAQQGLPRAQMKLAEMYAEAPSASPDQVKACMWFLLAAAALTDARRDNAQSGYKRVAARLSPAQLAKAKRLAEAWKPKTRDSIAAV